MTRFQRIEAAIEIAREHPPEIRRTDTVTGLRPAVSSAGERGHPVIMNSWVLNYFSDAQRDDYLGELDAIGATRDLSWVSAESPALCPGIPFAFENKNENDHLTALTLARWRNGVRTVEHLGVSHPHGYWLHWANELSAERKVS